MLAVGAIGPALVSGCATTGTMSTPRRAPDVDLPSAREAKALTRGAIGTLTATLARHPDLGTELHPLLAMHREHLRRLRSVNPGATLAPSPVKVPADPHRALARIRAGEASRATRLGALAGAAHSGGFARMLATMAAAIDQRSGVTT